MVWVERATGPLRRATRPPLFVRQPSINPPNTFVPKLGGKLPPRTGGWPVPPRPFRIVQAVALNFS